jgi:tetratricopeptide (TPR) repeat protein
MRRKAAAAAPRKQRGLKAISLLLVTVVLSGTVAYADSTGRAYVYGAGSGGTIGDFASPIPDPYNVLKVSDPSLMLSSPTDICLVDGYLYILNSIDRIQHGGRNKNGRVVVTDENLNFVREIFITDAYGNPYTIQDRKDMPLNLIEPRGIWVDTNRGENGTLFIADRSGHKILEIDLESGVVLAERGIPDNEQVYASLLGEDVNNPEARRTIHEKYLPCNIRTNSVGEIYIRAENDYRGLIRLGPDWEFISYFGAAQVQADSALVMAWRTIGHFIGANWVQVQFIPDEYSNFCMDQNDIIYTVRPSSRGNADMLLILNHLAVNINRTREDMFYGDPGSMTVRGIRQSSSFNAVAVDDDGFITILDKTNNRLFQYSPEGYETFVWGGIGVQKGTFVEPVSLATLNNNIYILDKSTAIITLMQPSGFANYMRAGQLNYTEGRMEEALHYYKQVIRLCPNYWWAYQAVGRAYYAMGLYEEAREVFRMAPGRSRQPYSDAFRQIRSQFIRENFTWVFTAFLIFMFLVFVWGILKRRGIIIVKKVELDSNNKLKYLVHCLFHPIDGFSEMRYNHRQSLLLANACMAFYVFAEMFSIVFWGFQFGGRGGDGFLIIYLLAYTAVYYFLFVLVNWLLGTFLVGKGTFKQIWINISYALIPVSVFIIIETLLSRVLTLDEFAIMNYVYLIGWIWTCVLIFFAVRRNVFSILLTFVGMLIVIFIIFLLVSLVLQLSSFVGAVYEEAIYRIRFR